MSTFFSQNTCERSVESILNYTKIFTEARPAIQIEFLYVQTYFCVIIINF